MKTIITLVGGLLAALALAASAVAQPNTASTVLGGTPTSGATLDVTFTVYGTEPVVPYAYALRNTCSYKSKGGSYTLGQRDDIVTWTDQGPNGEPRVTMPVYLQSVPAGASCKVSLVRNSTVVKGSTVSYSVG